MPLAALRRLSNVALDARSCAVGDGGNEAAAQGEGLCGNQLHYLFHQLWIELESHGETSSATGEVSNILSFSD